ncbi:MAG: CoA transferase [Intestinimonas sp.]|jgi:crotonobetainyl-CoA:carnitine CoA-transferase CaiB-like acyl-CoA transferase|nr:CoA transferase [Intestinimonas sp.]
MGEQALKGIKVLEVGNIVAGPWAGTLLGDFGADVIKVEPPKTGDLMRGMGRIKDLWFCVEGRNKRCITLNLKSEKGKEMMAELIKEADILLQNFRPGVFDRMGFTWERIQELNPRLIYVCSSGYGQTGPKAKKPGFDRIGLAEGGFLEVTGEPDRAPIKPGISVADFYTALFAALGAMMALYHRDVMGTGKGQMIDCCLTDTMLRMQESILAEYSYDGTIRTRIGNGTFVTIPSGHFKTKDGKYLVLSVTGDKLFNMWAEKIGRADMITNSKYNNQEARQKARDEINQICADWALEHTIDECLRILGDDIPAAKVYNVVDILNEQQYKVRNMILDVATEKFGTIKMQGIVPKMSETPGEVKWAGKPLGYFNDEIYSKVLHKSQEEIEQMKSEGVI